MAETPLPVLNLDNADGGNCATCGERRIDLPPPLLDPGDDFDWRVRDFDGFRQFMLEELAARFPERTRWTAADLEVVIVEALAAMLDQLSDMADRVFAEAYLETARQPASVRRLLSMIGYDAAALASAAGKFVWDPANDDANFVELEQYWSNNPHAMDQARREGPGSIRVQHRMVSLDDHAERLEDHPLVMRAKARSQWTGSWETNLVAVIPFDTTLSLDSRVPLPVDATDDDTRLEFQKLIADIEYFNRARKLAIPLWSIRPSLRQVLTPYVDAMRMVGSETLLMDAKPIGIALVVSIVVKPSFFAAEVRAAVRAALGNKDGGFFEPGRLSFGDDLFASDIIAAIMDVEGVENVCLIRFKRVGQDQPDSTAAGRIALDGVEIAVCDNTKGVEARGYFHLTTHGGM